MPPDIIIMLGTNDLKIIYNCSADDVAHVLKQYPEYVNQFCADKHFKRPKIVLARPASIDNTALKFVASMLKPAVYDEVSAQKSRQFAEPIKHVAEETDFLFFDVAQVTKTEDDGCHLDVQSHTKLTNEFTKLIGELQQSQSKS